MGNNRTYRSRLSTQEPKPTSSSRPQWSLQDHPRSPSEFGVGGSGHTTSKENIFICGRHARVVRYIISNRPALRFAGFLTVCGGGQASPSLVHGAFDPGLPSAAAASATDYKTPYDSRPSSRPCPSTHSPNHYPHKQENRCTVPEIHCLLRLCRTFGVSFGCVMSPR
jgi:hypothetical protein